MGVTLEKVQFKFASIIGELCNEPQILSQFAVWLDMRLAEFKLKGSISLDCSGDPVPPDWLEGLEEAMAAQITRKQNHRAHKHTIIPQDDEGDIFIITGSSKREAVSHHNDRGSNSSQGLTCLTNEHRKRSNQSWNGEEEYKSTCSPKRQRLSENNHSDIIKNQSLISIIAEQTEEGHGPASVQFNAQSYSEEQYAHVEQTESESEQFLQGSDLSKYFQSSSETPAAVHSSQGYSGGESDRGRALHNLNSFPYATGYRQKRERSIWSPGEKAAIHTYLLPIVQKTRKPPTKSEIQDLMQREPVLRNRHWEKIKFQAWSLYQGHVRRQNNLASHCRSNNRDASPRKNEPEQNNSE